MWVNKLVTTWEQLSIVYGISCSVKIIVTIDAVMVFTIIFTAAAITSAEVRECD